MQNNKNLGKFGLQNYQKNQIDKVPSPQAYSPNYLITKSTSSLGTFDKFEDKSNNQSTPGPGTYETPQSKSVGSCKIGKQ